MTGLCRWLFALALLRAAEASAKKRQTSDIHPEHSAVHVTLLFRRQAKPLSRTGSMEVEISSHGSLTGVNMTTPLKDMTSEYTGTIGVGTKPDGTAQFEARVVFDTGSTNLWIASILCKDYPCNPSTSSSWYDPKMSTTQEVYLQKNLVSLDGDIDIEFGTGELKGPLHVDTYRVGPLKVTQQPFAMIREMSGDVFSTFQFEGILGLAFKSLSFGGIQPFFERVIEQKLLEHNEFAFYLNVDSSQPSALLWGGVDKDMYDGQITMFPVVQTHYWSLDLVDLKFGDTSIISNMGTNRPVKVIVDSGTTYFTAPTAMYNALTNRMPEARCDAVEQYPDLTYVLKMQNGTLYDLKVTQRTYMVGDESSRCYPAFMQLDVNAKYGPAMILGEVFMRHFFTVFSRGDGSDAQAQIGFAHARLKAMNSPAVALSSSVSGLPSSRSASLIEKVPRLMRSNASQKGAIVEQLARHYRIKPLHAHD